MIYSHLAVHKWIQVTHNIAKAELNLFLTFRALKDKRQSIA